MSGGGLTTRNTGVEVAFLLGAESDERMKLVATPGGSAKLPAPFGFNRGFGLQPGER